MIDKISENFITKVSYYDSMTTPPATVTKQNSFEPRWSVQQILSQPPKPIMSVEESFTTHYRNWLSYSEKWNRLWTVCSYELLTYFDGVAVNLLIFAQPHIMTLCNILSYMLVYEKNARRFYIHSVFSCLKAVISQNFVCRSYSKIFQTFSTGSFNTYNMSKTNPQQY